MIERYFLPVVLAGLVLAACQERKKEQAPAMTIKSDTMYTCSMHPQVMQERPGKCPVCGMELIPVSMGGRKGELVELSDQQVQLGGIRVETAGATVVGDRMVLSGTLALDETRSASVSARIGGRVERLYFKAEGEYLRKGDKLYDLYSEELNNAQQEYLLALDRVDSLKSGVVDLEQLAEAARKKLLLWGMNERQVVELVRSRRVGRLTSFYSPASGYISSIESHEGDYVSEGSVVVRLADLSTVWVQAQVYASQVSALDRNGRVVVRFADLPGKEFPGRIGFVNPELDPGGRTNLVRVELANESGLLRPGMSAEVTVIGEAKRTLTLPAGAVLHSRGGDVVWVETGHNQFKPVMVGAGLESDGRVEIRSGLEAGDKVVTQGAYLVNSEYAFKNGQDVMAGMKM
jgi:Cu(I)/Ag(I) efflux system membrane fusion protein